jgi:enoyl-CoA hydratase/carnithine racemase
MPEPPEAADAPSPVLRQNSGGAATLTLNRPDKRNALSVDLFIALDAELAAIEAEIETVGLVILRAAGPVFSAGAALDRQPPPPPPPIHGQQKKTPAPHPPSPHFQAKTINRLAHLPQPVIAAVQGKCFTGGLELALAADIILAAESAQFADTHAKWALVPGWGMSQRLPRRIGAHKAREMMFTGRLYDGRAAERMGLANICVPDDQFEQELQSLADSILAQSWHSNRGNKRLLLETEGLSLQAGLAHETYNSPGIGADFAARVGETFGKR